MKIISLVCFLLFINFSFAQEVAIKFSVNNYVIAGLDAPIQIIGCTDFDAIEITAKNAIIRKHENNKYLIKAENPGVVYIEIYNKKTKLTQSIPVRVVKYPTPLTVLSVGNLFDDTKLALRRSRGLKTQNGDFAWANFVGYVEFDATIIHQNKVYNFNGLRGNFSKEMKSLFEKLEKDDLVVFYNVKYKFTTGSGMFLNDLVYKID